MPPIPVEACQVGDVAPLWTGAAVTPEAALTPEAMGPGACDARTAGRVDVTGLAVSLRTAELGALVARLPEALRRGGYADLTTWDDGGPAGHFTAVWSSGAFTAQVAGFDLRVGRDVPEQGVDVSIDDHGTTRLSEVPLRVTAGALKTPAGAAVEVATSAGLGWSDAGSWLVDPVPVRLPEARACGATIAAGTVATLDQDPTRTLLTAECRGTPTTPADVVHIGPGWVHLEWNVVPEALRPLGWEPGPDRTTRSSAAFERATFFASGDGGGRDGAPERPGAVDNGASDAEKRRAETGVHARIGEGPPSWQADGVSLGCEVVCRG